MKKAIQYSFLTAFLVFSIAISLNAQPPLPPADDGVPSDRIGAAAGAPVGNGTLILLTLAVAYAARKVYVIHETKDVE
jgi:hypothetical protein